MPNVISVQEASKMLGVTIKTLKLWDEEGKLKSSFRTPGGHRRYNLADIEAFIGKAKGTAIKVFVYSRVSTRKQKEAGNLSRQTERLISYCEGKSYEVIGVYEEVASGLNDSRRELTKILRKISEVDKIIVEYNDRLARFGFNYLKEYANSYNVAIEAVEEKDLLEPNEEMVNDLVSVVTCFSAKIYGARGGRKIKKTLDDLENERKGGVNINEDDDTGEID